ncbi:MAG: hypothetical protein ACRD10_05230, partial [Terriglobia bacterium]
MNNQNVLTGERSASLIRRGPLQRAGLASAAATFPPEIGFPSSRPDPGVGQGVSQVMEKLSTYM